MLDRLNGSMFYQLGLHRRFTRHLKALRIWSPGTNLPGRRVDNAPNQHPIPPVWLYPAMPPGTSFLLLKEIVRGAYGHVSLFSTREKKALPLLPTP